MDFVSEARTPKPLPGYGGTGIKRNVGNIKHHFDDREGAAFVAGRAPAVGAGYTGSSPAIRSD